MQKITPFLWFDTQAEDAANFYAGIFTEAKIGTISRYPEGGPGPAGAAMVVPFELFGQEFLALNGGPMYPFTPAVSFVVSCETQEEVDHYWDRLLQGGTPQQCGWLTDQFGLSWQIVPTALGRLVSTGDAAQSGRVMAAMMQMIKMDIATLEAAAAGN